MMLSGLIITVSLRSRLCFCRIRACERRHTSPTSDVAATAVDRPTVTAISAAPAPPDARDRRPRRGSSASDRHNRPSAPPAQGKALLISLRNIPPVLRLGDYFP